MVGEPTLREKEENLIYRVGWIYPPQNAIIRENIHYIGNFYDSRPQLLTTLL